MKHPHCSTLRQGWILLFTVWSERSSSFSSNPAKQWVDSRLSGMGCPHPVLNVPQSHYIRDICCITITGWYKLYRKHESLTIDNLSKADGYLYMCISKQLSDYRDCLWPGGGWGHQEIVSFLVMSSCSSLVSVCQSVCLSVCLVSSEYRQKI